MDQERPQFDLLIAAARTGIRMQLGRGFEGRAVEEIVNALERVGNGIFDRLENLERAAGFRTS